MENSASTNKSTNFSDAVVNILKRSMSFSGRSGRLEFFLWWLSFIVYFLLFALIADTFHICDPVSAAHFIHFIAGFILLIYPLPLLSVTIRRLHDTDRSAWYILYCFIPPIGLLVGILLFLTLLLQPGTRHPNRFDTKTITPVPPLTPFWKKRTGKRTPLIKRKKKLLTGNEAVNKPIPPQKTIAPEPPAAKTQNPEL